MQNSPTVEMPKPLGVVAHDAGGANQIIAHFLQHGGIENVHAYMVGPALILWQRAFPNHVLCASLESLIASSRSLLSGTGWATDLEFDAIDQGKKAGLPTIAMLDHWVNYAPRFTRNGRTIWPDQFWVVDEDAYVCAKQIFKNQKIVQVSNSYLESEARKIAKPNHQEHVLLYVLEPTRSQWGHVQQGEFQALDFFVSQLPKLSLPKDIRIRLRQHPAEEKGKYAAWIARHSHYPIGLDFADSLAEAMSAAKWVAGCESYAMIVALAAERTVYGTLPPHAPKCRLPHKGIVHLNML